MKSHPKTIFILFVVCLVILLCCIVMESVLHYRLLNSIQQKIDVDYLGAVIQQLLRSCQGIYFEK